MACRYGSSRHAVENCGPETQRSYGRRGRETARAQDCPVDAETRTLCPYCGVGCGLIARTEGGRLESVAGAPLYPVNHGRTCRKPLELRHAVHARDRATVPLLRERRDVRFREA